MRISDWSSDVCSSDLLNISYHWSPDVMTYFYYSKGYKSSGYEQRLAPGTPEVPSFRPEYVDCYRLGFKASVPGTGLAISASACHSHYSIMKVSVFGWTMPKATQLRDAKPNRTRISHRW